EIYQRAINGADAGRIPASQADPLIARYGLCLTQLAKYEQADAPLRNAYQRLRDSSPQSDPVLQSVIAALADVCRHTGRPDEATGWESELAQRRASTRASTGASTQPGLTPLYSRYLLLALSSKAPAKKRTGRFIRLLLLAALIYLGLVIVFYVLQDWLLFPGRSTQGQAQAIIRESPQQNNELVRFTTT